MKRIAVCVNRAWLEISLHKRHNFSEMRGYFCTKFFSAYLQVYCSQDQCFVVYLLRICQNDSKTSRTNFENRTYISDFIKVTELKLGYDINILTVMVFVLQYLFIATPCIFVCIQQHTLLLFTVHNVFCSASLQHSSSH